MTILCGYARVSGDSQKDNYSLPAQREAITQFCKQNGHILFNIFEEVASAEDASQRQAFQFAINTVLSGLADGLVVHKMDRFCRKLLDAEKIRDQFEKSGKVLYCVMDPVDLGTDDGQMMFQFKNVLQEYERKKIRERCAMGRARKREGNGFYGGSPPYGYDAVKKTLIPNLKEQAIIKEIFRWREQRWTISQIAKQLNDMGIVTKHGKVWGQQQVYRILCDFPPITFRLGIAPDFLTDKDNDKTA